MALCGSAGAQTTGDGRSYDGPPTLLGGKPQLGGYGGLTVAYSRFDGDDGVLIGGEAALLFNHRLALGAAGYGWVTEPEEFEGADGIDRHMHVGYGGAVGRYAFFTDSMVYMTAGLLIGGGAVVMAPEVMGRGDAIDDDDIDRFFAIEPQISAHVNLTRWMRLGLQGGYRVTAGITKFGYDDGAMSGPVLGGTMQFGWL